MAKSKTHKREDKDTKDYKRKYISARMKFGLMISAVMSS